MIFVLAVFAAAIVGFFQAGVLGLLTGGLTVFLLSVAQKAAGTQLGGSVPLRRAMRAGAIAQIILVAIGAFVGGWRWGWLGAIVGTVVGAALTRGMVVIGTRESEP